ncbi:hypothetical protein CRENBAI_011808 [Crenichthys baileyi]|uniref:Macro domain-containing protein n=1 Tax=Crenichthys baileyi TaxID=28760 RepID=A0AAV9RS61_9TELE
MDAKLDFPLNGASVNVVKKSGHLLCKILYDKFGCVATIEGVEMEKESGNKNQRQAPTISPEKRFEFVMHSGVKVSVWKADLTHFPADAVVNAANEDLKHCGGLALALSKAGGPQIQMESDDYIKNYGKLQTGKTVVFDAGLLPCKKIIHAVGPELSMNSSRHDVQKAKLMLEAAIWSILNSVAKYNLADVAIPAISSGLFHYPLPECARTIVSTVKHYYDNLPIQNHCPKEIFLVNNDEPTVQEMERACWEIFSPQQRQSYSQAAWRNTRSADHTPPPSVQMGNVLLTLKKGKIEEEKTHVIVNTASEGRDLSLGQISKAILKKAGSEIQKEINRAVQKSNIICTQGYGLNCKEVYHTTCTMKNRGQENLANKSLHSSVFECLVTAANAHHNSISFPAIGTGNLGFHKRESASIMSNAVALFAERNSSKLQVYFVIYPSDNDTYQAFKAEIKVLQEKVSQFILATASGPRDDSHTTRAPTPTIILLGPSDESRREAEKWLNDLLSVRSRTVKICNNFISHFSEENHLRLSRLAKNGLFFEEFMTQGHACIEIKGETKEDSVVAALEVEDMLCKIQKEFISEEEHDLKMLMDMNVSFKKKTVEHTSPEFSEQMRFLKTLGLLVVKVEKVENFALKKMFDLKKKQLHCSTSTTMFQRIPAQFCEMISRIGFQAECAPPEDPKYGEGIYFARKINVALELWREKSEEYLYFVEAEVLTGNSARGKPGLNMPPPVGKDPSVTHDSVDGGSDISVIFSGYQALPKYIIIYTTAAYYFCLKQLIGPINGEDSEQRKQAEKYSFEYINSPQYNIKPQRMEVREKVLFPSE